jgi:ATP-dependent helicase/DNAse subunit B
VSYRRGAPLHTAPLVKACLAPFAAVRSRLARDEILAICNSSYLAPSAETVPADVVEEVLIKARYMDETMGTLEQVLDRRISALRKAGRDTTREERVRRYLLPILKDLRRFRREKTLGEFVTLLEDYIDRHRLFRQGIEADDPRALKRDISAISLFRRVLDDLETDIGTLGMGERRFSPSAYAELLQEGMEGVFLTGERGAGVSIMTFHDARGLTFEHLFIGGLNEGITPARHEGHPLFKDNVKILWKRCEGINPFRTASEKGMEEPLLFYLALGCAARSLTFSFSHLDGRGNAMLRSPFLDDILAKFPLEEVRTPASAITPEIQACLEREELLNSLASYGFFAVLPEHEAGPVRDSLLRIAANSAVEKERETYFSGDGEATAGGGHSIHCGLLRRDDIVAELGAFFSTPPGSTFAPTILEEYGSCPFRYFMQRVIGASPLEKPDLELEAKDEGSLVHELLHALFRGLADKGMLPISDIQAARAVLRETSGSVFSRWEKEQYTGEPLLWEIGKERLVSILDQLVEMEGKEVTGLVPRLFEFEFPVYDVDCLDGSTVSLRGKIDRVDAGDDGRLRVVDYKLAGDIRKYRELLKKDNLGVTSFQMPVYLLAARQELERVSSMRFNRYSVLYWLLARLHQLDHDFGAEQGDDIAGFFSTDRDVRRNLGDGNFLNRLCAMVRSMKAGNFRIAPKDCGFCRFRSVCRYVDLPAKNEQALTA